MSSNKKFDTLFLDRDGVLNKKIDNGYVLDFDQIEILPGIEDFLQSAVDYFERILVVTNQRCVGRGLLSIEDLFEINTKINGLTGDHIDRFYVCPHLDEDNCDCRKPKNGMFLQAGRDYEVDFSHSWMVGDSETDLIPAKQLGIATFYVSTKQSLFADKNITGFFELKDYLETLP
jgi:D-glycero-D-manno-heptose 1,7-bisphosphate phosphatase